MTLPDRIVVPRRVRLRVGFGAAVVLVLVGLAVAILVTALGAQGSSQTVAPGVSPPGASEPDDGSPSDAAAPPGPAGAAIFVHLLGAIARPGLYELREGDRAIDAVAAAGGFTDVADQAQLNLARLLADGEQIYVPAIGEIPSVAPGSPGVPGGPAPGGAVPGKVNLNTADAAALDTLPGVGPATAQRILDWRAANGRFTAVEDLLSVSGIGEKTFADLKDLVIV